VSLRELSATNGVVRVAIVVHRGGRYVYAVPEELNRWLGKESHAHAPVHIATGN
jgi:hypothetical protein